jgi:hypothetical protein
MRRHSYSDDRRPDRLGWRDLIRSGGVAEPESIALISVTSPPPSNRDAGDVRRRATLLARRVVF